MKKCPQCGNMVLDSETTCDICGSQIYSAEQKKQMLEESMENVDYKIETDKSSHSYIFALLLGIFLPPIGVIAGIAWLKSEPELSKFAFLGAVFTVVMGLVFGFVLQACLYMQ